MSGKRILVYKGRDYVAPADLEVRAGTLLLFMEDGTVKEVPKPDPKAAES